MEKKTIGIIGGMGPLATADLFRKIVLHTEAKTDQEHLRILIDNNTAIPDRTAAIIVGKESPVPQMVASATLLAQMGAQLLIMPCNTAHGFHGAVQACVDIPVLHMIELTCQALIKRGVRRAALLATRGTVRSGVYQAAFAGSGITLITPNEEQESVIMDLVYSGVKAGKRDYDVTAARRVMNGMIDDGAEVLILGCTELPIAMEMYGLGYNTCDATLELALGAIRAAGGRCI